MSATTVEPVALGGVAPLPPQLRDLGAQPVGLGEMAPATRRHTAFGEVDDVRGRLLLAGEAAEAENAQHLGDGVRGGCGAVEEERHRPRRREVVIEGVAHGRAYRIVLAALARTEPVPK